MDRYIKLNDLLKLIKEHHIEIEQDYKENKICFSSKVAMDGVLAVLEQNILIT